MTSTKNWKELVHEGIVKYMPENARYKDGVPNIAAITRAGILADQSGEYKGFFTNEEIQHQVSLIHEGGTPINCIRWYRNTPGQRKNYTKVSFNEAYKLFKEQGKEITQEDLAKIAEANLAIIFNARGADLTILSTYKIMDNYKSTIEAEKEKAAAEKTAKVEQEKAEKEAAKKAKALEKEKAKAEKEAAKKAEKEAKKVEKETEKVKPVTNSIKKQTLKKIK